MKKIVMSDLIETMLSVPRLSQGGGDVTGRWKTSPVVTERRRSSLKRRTLFLDLIIDVSPEVEILLAHFSQLKNVLFESSCFHTKKGVHNFPGGSLGSKSAERLLIFVSWVKCKMMIFLPKVLLLISLREMMDTEILSNVSELKKMALVIFYCFFFIRNKN